MYRNITEHAAEISSIADSWLWGLGGQVGENRDKETETARRNREIEMESGIETGKDTGLVCASKWPFSLPA